MQGVALYHGDDLGDDDVAGDGDDPGDDDVAGDDDVETVVSMLQNQLDFGHAGTSVSVIQAPTLPTWKNLFGLKECL